MVDQVHLVKRQFREIKSRFWNLQFQRPAKTSKSTLLQHRVLYLLAENESGEIHCGEVAPLTHLSNERVDDCPTWVKRWWDDEVSFEELPSAVKFGLECLHNPLETLAQNQRPMLFNGLIWMNEIEAMYKDASVKLKAGFDCIKIKVGALDFQAECHLIEKLRNEFGSDFTLRLDANGAWDVENALSKLEFLSKYNIHSIEQPIAPGQWINMAKVVRESPIAIALDEELINVQGQQKIELLNTILPDYLIIKPTLHGGFISADEWISLAAEKNIQWWATSALESNVGLAHIYKWLLKYNTILPQGLGTGSLYTNNWESPLEVKGQMLCWNKDRHWRQPWI